MGNPDFGFLWSTLTGSSGAQAVFGFPWSATNIRIGQNPPFAINDLIAFFPNFLGTPVSVTGNLTVATDTITGASSVAGLAPGQFLTDGAAFLPSYTLITSAAGSTVSLSNNAIASKTGDTFSVYVAPFVPLPIINAYIALASASINQARWQEQWAFAMALFVAHYLTLWLQTQGNPATTAGQIAAAGIAKGFQTAKAVDKVSVSQENIFGEAFADWGSYQLTSYGQQLITLAQLAGYGPMYVY